MTTIIFLEDSIPLQGVHDATDSIVNYHVHAIQARFPWELETLIMAFVPVKSLKDRLTGPWPYADYKAVISQLDKDHPIWSVRDDRVLFFLNEFAALANVVARRGQEPRLLWVDLERSRTEYQKELQKLNREAFNRFTGPKLHLTTDDPAKALKFALGDDEVAVKTVEARAEPATEALAPETKDKLK